MNYFPRFAFPWTLIFLILVPLACVLGSRIRSLSAGRKWAAIILRAIILTCLVAALAGIEIVKKNDKLAVFFILDHSNSIPPATRSAAERWIRDTCRRYMTSKDESGVIVFGEEPSIELSIGPTMELKEVKSFIGGEQTDIAASIRLAMAAFPQGCMKRIVIVTDGNETRGSAVEETKVAKANGIGIDIEPLIVGAGAEVRMREITAPSFSKADEPFQLRIVVNSSGDTDAILKVFRRIKDGRELLGERGVTLQKGDNVFLLTQELSQPGFYEYDITVESKDDSIMANNEGRAFTILQGEPIVLLVAADSSYADYIETALRAEGLNVSRSDPAAAPSSLEQFENYDAIILSNVGATDITSDQMKAIEAAVRDLGIGLVMIGGPDTFGAGGFLDTPIERALPVDMDIKQRKILPRGALALIMHTCEIPDGNVWAREIGLASLNVLSAQDLMGAVGYMYGGGNSGDTWIYELQPVGDKSMMRQQLTRAASQIGDMPDVAPSLELAYKALKNADAAVKRIVIISDGDPASPSGALLKKIAEAKISVSTVCIAPHSPNDQNMLRWIAESTGGRFYFVTNPNNLPQIFSKEAAEVKRGILVEEPFTPKLNHFSEILQGLSGAALPTLRGYVITSPKDKATVPLVSHEGDPVLAHWRYGLGKSVAFTSDATSRWAADWLAWSGFNRFWAQTVRWAMRDVKQTDFRVDTTVKDGMGRVRIDAVDDRGRFINYLSLRGVITGPGPDFRRREIDLLQTGPGIYESKFPVENPGAYMVNIVYAGKDDSQGMIPTGFALNYSREYEYTTTNRTLMENIASISGGKVLAAGDNPFTHNLKASPAITPIWHYLVIIAALLFPIEIFIRRIVFDLRTLYIWMAVAAGKIPVVGKFVKQPASTYSIATGRYVSASEDVSEKKRSATAASFGVAVEVKTAASPPDKAGSVSEQKSEKSAKGEKEEYTRQLLDAKKRATARHRRAGKKEDKENT